MRKECENQIKKHTKHNFTQVSNTIVEDKKLSFKAKGVFLYMWSKPDGWKFWADDIKKHGTEGKEAIKKAIDELETEGYLVKTRVMQGNLKNRYDYNLSDEADFLNEELNKISNEVPNVIIPSMDDYPISVSSADENSAADNPPLSKTNSSNTKSVADETSAKYSLDGDKEGKVLSNKLVDNMLKTQPNLKVADKRESFAKDFALAIRRDARTYDELNNILDWLSSDGKTADFWSGVILSGRKLREQFDVLEINMRKDGYIPGVNGITKDTLKKFLISKFGKSKSFMKFTDNGKKIMVAFSGDYCALANYNTGEFLSKKQTDYVWETMLKNHKSLFPECGGETTTNASS